MKKRLFFGLLLSYLATALGATAGQVRIHLAPEAQQEIKGWGLSPAPFDWSGCLALHGEMRAHVREIYRNSGATTVRLTIGGANIYDNEAKKVRAGAALRALADQLALLDGTGIREYILCILSPPAGLKKYYATDPYVLGDPNSLRAESEPLFARYVTEILDQLRTAKHPLPAALGLQMQPDDPPANWGIPVTTAHGAVYSPQQWARILQAVRLAMDKAGYTHIGLLGPETYGLDGWSRWNAASGSDSIAAPSVESLLGGWAYYSNGENASSAIAMDPLRPVLSRMKARNAVWMLSANCSTAANDAEALVATFTQMQYDLIDAGVSHWFWRYAFDWRASPEVMMHGRKGNWTPVGMALATLWKFAPPGSRVHSLAISGEQPADVAAIAGFALTNFRRTVYTCVNKAEVPIRVQWRGTTTDTRATLFVGAKSTPLVPLSSGEDFTMVLPAKSVGLIVERHPSPLFSAN